MKTGSRKPQKIDDAPDEPTLTRNLPAERAVIGGCLLLLAALDDVMEILQPDHFYDEVNRLIYGVICDMRLAGKRGIDALTLADELEKRKLFSDSLTPKTIADLMESVPHAAFVLENAKIVLDCARRRGAEIAARSLLMRIPDRSIETDELLADAESSIHRAMEAGITDEPQTIGEILVDVVNEIGSERRPQRSVPTDWSELDEMTNGLPLGGVVILAARPSAGKTACALSIAVRTAEQGNHVLVTSYEQTQAELAQRLLSIYSGIPHHKLAKSRVSEDERHQIMVSAGALQVLPIMLDDSCRQQNQLITMIRRQVRRKKTKLVIVDYLQLIEPEDRRIPREQQVATISRQLKRVAMACNVAVLCLSQLNREVEKRDSKRPRLSDLRESGSIEQDADQVWLLHRPNSDAPTWEHPDDHAVLEIAKNRNGARGEIKLGWQPNCMKYSKEFESPL